MRISAFVLIAATFAAGTSLGAKAESFVTDGVTYSYGADSALTNSSIAPQSYSYGSDGVTTMLNQPEIVYAPQDTGYEIVEQSPIVYETAYDASYETPMDSDASLDIIMTETIDGIVYETVVDGQTAVGDQPQVNQTY